MLMYVFDGFYTISNSVKSNVNRVCNNGNDSFVIHKGVIILPEIVCILSSGYSQLGSPSRG